jgi:hypothetical protein
LRHLPNRGRIHGWFLIAVALMPVGYVLGIILAAMLMFGVEGGSVQVPAPVAAIPPAPTPIKSAPPPQAPWSVPPYSGPRIMPPWPALSYNWKEMSKEDCELLPDREEARLCVRYPQRESILNSLVDRAVVHSYVGVRFQYKVFKSCPIIPTGEARAIVCGKLAEQYELYCCH